MQVRCLVVCLALSMLSAGLTHRAEAQAAAPAVSEESELKAREAFQRGRIHYDNGEFERAAQAFEEAYSLSQRHQLLYNLYLAYRDANQQEKAAEALRNYLTRVEVIENRAQLEARLRALEEGIEKRKAEEAREAEQRESPAEAEPQPVTAPQAPAIESQGSPSWLVPAIVMGAGGAMMLGSIATGVMAGSKQKELEDACSGNVCDPSLKATADSGKTLAVVTDVLLFGGAAVAATGVVLFFLKRGKREVSEPRTTANFACTSRACGGSLGMRF